MTRDDLLSRLDDLCACAESRVWATGTSGTPEELWNTCPRGDWLLWLAMRADVDRSVVVLAACDCAETAAPHLADSARGLALAALEETRKWARGEATQRDVRNASAALATRHVSAVAVDHAAYAVAYAVYAAFVSARSVAANDASMAAAHASVQGGESEQAGLQRSADLVRARIPWADVEAALLGGAS